MYAVEMASLYGLTNSHRYSTYTRSPCSEHLSDYESIRAFYQHSGATSQTANYFQRLMNMANYRKPKQVTEDYLQGCVYT